MTAVLYTLLWASPKPYVIRQVVEGEAAVRARLGDEATDVRLVGDVLVFTRRQTAGYVGITGGVQESMRHIAGTDLWTLHLQRKGWERAVIQYAFFTPDQPSPPYDAYRVWRGANAPVLALASPLRGRLEHVNFSSQALGELRRVSVYRPPSGSAGAAVVYLADGETTEGFAQVIEPLILARKIRPVVLVGIYSGDWDTSAGRPKVTGGTRGAEYGGSGRRAANHRKFFTQEVRGWAVQRFGVSDRLEDTAVAGFSSGGRFATSVAGDYGAAFVMASGGATRTAARARTRWFFSVGEIDSSYWATVRAYRSVKASGGVASLDTFLGGHDFEIWRLGLVAMLKRAFPG